LLSALCGKNNRKGNIKFFARPNDLQIGQAKTTKKFKDLRNPMGIFQVLQAPLPDQFEMRLMLSGISNY
jgi:hypothetical protein